MFCLDQEQATGADRAGAVAWIVGCQGWLGEAGALWADADPAASNTPSMVTELVKDLFIPDAPMTEPIPYRCIPRTMVVHINKVISSEQPDDSIPVLRRGKPWDRENRFLNEGIHP